MNDCVFCGVVDGSAAAEIVYSGPEAVAFLDRSPVFKGHVLVVPRRHVETLPDLTEEELAPFFAVVQRVARVMPAALDADGTFVAINNVISQSVPHVHAHVVPRRRKDGLRGFFWPRVRYDGTPDAAQYASLIRAALDMI